MSVPSGKSIRLEELFSKELTGSTIEKLDSNGDWTAKEIVLYENNTFALSEEYLTLAPLETIQLELKRESLNRALTTMKHSICHNFQI